MKCIEAAYHKRVNEDELDIYLEHTLILEEALVNPKRREQEYGIFPNRKFKLTELYRGETLVGPNLNLHGLSQPKVRFEWGLFCFGRA